MTIGKASRSLWLMRRSLGVTVRGVSLVLLCVREFDELGTVGATEAVPVPDDDE